MSANKLRKFEIDAVLDTILTKIRETFKPKNYSAQVKKNAILVKKEKEAKEAFNKASDALHKFDAAELKKAGTKENQYYHYNHYSNRYSDYADTFKKQLENAELTSKLKSKEIENDIIINSNKELSEIIEILTKKYC